MRPPPFTRFLIRALFAAMVLATVAAFLVAARIKRGQPVVEKVRISRYLSPNGDGYRERGRFSFRLKKTDRVDVAIVNRDGDVVRELAGNRALCGVCTHRFAWNGRDGAGVVAPDGEYFLRVTLREQGRTVTSPRKLFLDTTPPRPLVRSVTPSAISPDGDGRGDSAVIRFEGPAGVGHGARPAELIVYRTGRRSARAVARLRVRRGATRARWRGRVRGGGIARPGNYLIAIRARDVAGNVGSGPAALPPRRGAAGGHPGVVVRYIAAHPPAAPVRPGGALRFRVATDRRDYHWVIRRALGGSALRGGNSPARVLRVRAPADGGAYLLELSAGSHRYRAPFAVRSGARRRLLVVLPAIQWQAENLLDADEDGWGETLEADRAVLLRRPFAAGGLPAGFQTEMLPLLALLGREGPAYDLTTDVALARGSGPSAAGHAGLLFLGPERYLPPQVVADLRSYVESGGRVAWLGAGSFRREVRLSGRRLFAPGALRPENAFGERVRVRRVARGPLVALADRIGFFAGAGASFGAVSRIETTERLPGAARLLAGAGRESDRPAFVVYRLGRGVVVRLGADGLPAQAASGPGAAPSAPGIERIMVRVWKLLSR